MPAPIQLKYRAFLSYAHANASWGRWLHGQLEGFRIDKDLVGRKTVIGLVPKSLRPIFRDREDFSGGHSLTEATIAALDQSAALIVLCSPVAARRPAVNEEVRLFRSRHPERPVIPVILDGAYPTPSRRPCASSWRPTTLTDRPRRSWGRTCARRATASRLASPRWWPGSPASLPTPSTGEPSAPRRQREPSEGGVCHVGARPCGRGQLFCLAELAEAADAG